MTTVFLFQAEDGIRDYKVTGVQTCALPICRRLLRAREDRDAKRQTRNREPPHWGCFSCQLSAVSCQLSALSSQHVARSTRSAERCVGKECRVLLAENV